MRFPLFGAIDIIHSVLRVLFVGLVLYLGIASAISILACYAVAAAAVAAIFFVYGNTVAGWRKVHPGPSDWRALLRSSGPILASTGAGSVVSRLDVFLLALRSNPVQLGLYSAALTIATIPEILGAYLAPVFQPRIFPSCKAGTFRGLFRRVHLAVYAVVGALFAFVFLAGRPLLSRLLPLEYEPSIGLVLILIPGTLAVASLFPLTLSFLLMMRPRTFLIVESVAAPILVASYFWLTPAGGALAAAWITCVYRLLKAAIVQTRAYALAGDPLDRGATAPAVPAR
jgi:O-antigen/teichoic acid export membrane protein